MLLTPEVAAIAEDHAHIAELFKIIKQSHKRKVRSVLPQQPESCMAEVLVPVQTPLPQDSTVARASEASSAKPIVGSLDAESPIQKPKLAASDPASTETERLGGGDGTEGARRDGGGQEDAWPSPFVSEAGWRGAPLNPEEALQAGRVRVLTTTWNMHATLPPSDLSALLPRGQYHIYAIATQECERSIAQSAIKSSKKKWEARLSEVLGEDYVMLRSVTLQAIHLAVYLHRKLLPAVSCVGSDAVPTGFGDTLGNKGGVGVCFTLGCTSLLFLGCHLEAHQNRTQQRNENFHRIDSRLALPKQAPASQVALALSDAASSGNLVASGAVGKSAAASTGASVTQGGRSSVGGAQPSSQPPPLLRAASKAVRQGYAAIPREPMHRASARFDRVFWMGDLNYRVNHEADQAKALISSRTGAAHRALLEREQLRCEIKSGRAFVGFEEGALNFAPTYKFDKGTDVYDSSKKQRVPSWTDRVLYRSAERGGLALVEYASRDGFRTSDHRPVVATFVVRFRPLHDPLHEGTHLSETGKGHQSAVCTVS